MKLVTAVLLSRSVFRDDLTYFTAQEVAPGDLLTVPLRGHLVDALAVRVEPLIETKTALRRADFNVRKVSQIKTRQFFDARLVEAARATADYFAAPPGAVLKSLLPQIILDKAGAHSMTAADPSTNKVKIEKLVIQDTDEERWSYYKSLARQEFARKRSVFVCLPTAAELFTIREQLGKGIGDYTLLLHGRLNREKLLAGWQRALTDPHPLLVLATPLFLSLPRADLSTIIIERESSPAYRTIARPFIDYRYFAEKLSVKRQLRFILGDIILRPETLWRVERHELWPAQAPKQKLPGSNQNRLVAVNSSDLFSAEAKELINRTDSSGERLFLLANRRGLSPLVICEDCGQAVLCGNCTAPVVLHEAGLKQGIRETAIFRCHQCGETRSAEEKCRYCGSWRLRALGTGIDRVARELKTLSPARAIFQLDSDRVKNQRQAEAVAAKFSVSRGGILLATEMALPFLREKVPHSLVVTVDAMLSLPDFRIGEQVFGLIARLRALTVKELIVQTRQADNPTLTLAVRGQLLDFYRETIDLREKLKYPPFTVFIKISHHGPPVKIGKIFALLKERFAAYEPESYPALHQPGRGLVRRHLLLKVKPDRWPETNLLKELKSLPPDFTVSVDPESIL